MEGDKEYINLKILGRGNKGEITRKVKSLKDNNIYVLKDLGEQQLSETQKDILKLLEQNECPYIVKHYTLNKTNCIKTDFINDIDLLDYLNTYIDLENPIEEKVLWKIFRQCIESVKYLHEKNIVHRNIRLENFYITDDKEIKLGNFRYATLINEAKEDMNYPEEGILYKSAETLNKYIYNKKSDLYALGVVFYKLCYFEFPYDITYKSNKEDDSKGIYQLNPIPKKELGYSKELNELINSLLNIFTQKVEEEKIYQMAINKPLEYKCKNTCIESIIRCLSPFSFFFIEKESVNLEFIEKNKEIYPVASIFYNFCKYFSAEEQVGIKNKEKYVNDIINLRTLLEKKYIGIKKEEEVDPKVVINFIISNFMKEIYDNTYENRPVIYNETKDKILGKLKISQNEDSEYIFNFFHTNLDLCENKNNKYDISKIFDENLNSKLKLEYQFPRYVILSIDHGKNYDHKSEIIYPKQFTKKLSKNKDAIFSLFGLLLKIDKGEERFISFYKKVINGKFLWVLSEDDEIKRIDTDKLEQEIKDSKGIIEMIFYKGKYV